MNKDSTIELSNCFKENSEVACNFSAPFLENVAKTNNYSRERVEKLLKVCKQTIVWKEKEIEISKINLKNYEIKTLSKMKR